MSDDEALAPTAAAQRLLGGRYVLEEQIAAGGMATVWRAHDETLARTVAVKLLHEHLASDAALRERFRREAVASAGLGHPGIVGVYDTADDEGLAYLVMEYVEGETLREVLAARGRLEPEDVAAIGVQVAEALAYAHARGLVHRDIKPANLLVDESGAAKVSDFGIAKVADSARDLTQTGTVLGTAAYVAPEQVRGDPVDGRADQYALACVLYECLAGRRPFESDAPMTMATMRLTEDPLPVRAIRPDVPRPFDEVLQRALSREPEDRYPDLREFAAALAPWASDGPALLVEPAEEAVEEPVGARSFLRAERSWLAPVVALLVVAATLVGVGLATGVLESERMPSLTASEATDTDVVEIAPEGLAPFDPPEVEGYEGGDDWEHDQLLEALVDGDPDTAWRTERYDDTAFGGRKPGVGAVLDLGQPHVLEAATVRTPTAGISYELRVADEPSQDAEDWTVAARVDDAAEVEDVALGGVEGRYVLLYVVPHLVAVDGGALAAFSQVELRGAPR